MKQTQIQLKSHYFHCDSETGDFAKQDTFVLVDVPNDTVKIHTGKDTHDKMQCDAVVFVRMNKVFWSFQSKIAKNGILNKYILKSSKNIHQHWNGWPFKNENEMDWTKYDRGSG